MSDDLGKYLLAAFVLLFAVLAWRAWQTKQASPHWPSVTGQITASRAVARNETGDHRGTLTHEWLTEVRYDYTVEGVRYTGNTLRAFGRHHFSEEQALAELAPFALGVNVLVYYDPDKPSRSVLIPG